MLGMRGGGASSMNMSKEGGAPSQGKSATGEEGSVQGVQGGEPRRKKLRELLEVEGAELEGRSEGVKKAKDRGADKKSERVEGDEEKGTGRRESGKAHNATSESGMDESGFGESEHP